MNGSHVNDGSARPGWALWLPARSKEKSDFLRFFWLLWWPVLPVGAAAGDTATGVVGGAAAAAASGDGAAARASRSGASAAAVRATAEHTVHVVTTSHRRLVLPCRSRVVVFSPWTTSDEQRGQKRR